MCRRTIRYSGCSCRPVRRFRPLDYGVDTQSGAQIFPRRMIRTLAYVEYSGTGNSAASVVLGRVLRPFGQLRRVINPGPSPDQEHKVW